jgi:hypothetical protein
MLAAIPLLLLPVAAYAVLALTLGGGLYASDIHARITRPLFEFSTAAGGTWPVSAADLLLAFALIAAFLEMLKSIEDRRVAIANHALSIALFIGCLAAILLAPAFATSTFFLITLMVLLDLVAGFVAAMGAAGSGGPAL